MRTRYRIQVGGVQMDTLDKDLYILDIQYSGLQRDVRTQTAANLDGMMVAHTYDGKQTVTVTFELHIYDIAKRNAACQKVAAWAAAGGSLATNDRPDQYLRNVVCEQFPTIESARNWTDPLTVVFATTVTPYWLSTTAKTRNVTGKNFYAVLSLDGNVGSSLVNVTVTAKEKFTSLQITSGNTMLKLSGLNVTAGKQVVIDYVSSRYLRIRMGKTKNGTFTSEGSLMANLDPASSDNLLAECNADTRVSVVANGKVQVDISGRGQWL